MKLMNYRGSKQAALVARNIQHDINNEPLEEYTLSEPPGIHLTLGIVSTPLSGLAIEEAVLFLIP